MLQLPSLRGLWPLSYPRLTARFLLIGFLGCVLLCSLVLAQALNYQAQAEVIAQARLLSDTISSARNYTQAQVTPILTDASDVEFYPQSVPSYSSQEVFRGLRENPAYADFFYKEAVTNPTNLRDKADTFEGTLIDTFKKQTSAQELTGFHQTAQGRFFYIAQPLTIQNPSCLQCHSTPEVAPKAMVNHYGSRNGFGWKLNETVGIRITYLPAQQIFQKAKQAFLHSLGMLVLVFGVVAIALYLLQKRQQSFIQ